MSIYNLGGGGGAPVLEQRTVTPSTSQQIVKPSRDEYDGLSQVTVEATPLEARTVNPLKYTSTIFPSDPNIGFSSVTVNGVNLQSKTLTPSTLPYTITPDASYIGLSQATVQKPNTLIASNIKNGVSIFGVTGTLEPENSTINTTAMPTTVNGKICLELKGIPSTATEIIGFSVLIFSASTSTTYIQSMQAYTGYSIQDDSSSLTTYSGTAIVQGSTGGGPTTAYHSEIRSNGKIYLYAMARDLNQSYTLTFDPNKEYYVYAMYK